MIRLWTPKTLTAINAVCAVLNTGAVIVLVGVTVWYARSTARMLRHMSDQTEAVRRQSRILVAAARISAAAPFVNMPTGDEQRARTKLAALETELDGIVQELD